MRIFDPFCLSSCLPFVRFPHPHFFVLSAFLSLVYLFLFLSFTYSQGAEDQPWHADGPHLDSWPTPTPFGSESMEGEEEEEGEEKKKGKEKQRQKKKQKMSDSLGSMEPLDRVSQRSTLASKDKSRTLPAHALNVFVPLVNVTRAHGPTELVPGTSISISISLSHYMCVCVYVCTCPPLISHSSPLSSGSQELSRVRDLDALIAYEQSKTRSSRDARSLDDSSSDEFSSNDDDDDDDDDDFTRPSSSSSAAAAAAAAAAARIGGSMMTVAPLLTLGDALIYDQASNRCECEALVE